MPRLVTALGWLAFFSLLGMLQLGYLVPSPGPQETLPLPPHDIGLVSRPPHSGDEASFRSKHMSSPKRSRAALWTDKPVYWAGETIRIATWNVELEHGPKAERLFLTWRLLDASHSPVGSPASGEDIGSIDLPEGLAGGEYLLQARQSSLVLAERRIEVRSERRPQMKLAMEFLRQGYAPGDTARAVLTARTLAGAPAQGAVVDAVVSGGGIDYVATSGVVSADGTLLLEVALPAESELDPRTALSLAATVTQGGRAERTALTVPLLTSALDIVVFPESGDLVQGLASAVYVEASTPWGEPADFEGSILRVDGGRAEVVAAVRTAHEGRGRSSAFLPEAGASYELRVTEPSTVSQAVALPAPVEAGGHIGLLSQVYAATTPVHLDLAVTSPGVHFLSISAAEKVVSQQAYELQPAGTPLRVAAQLPPSAVGVLRATLYTADFTPVTERLLFVRPPREVEASVTVSLASDAAVTDGFVPGDSLNVKVELPEADEAASLFVSVTDESALDLPQPRRRPPRLPAMLLLEPEVLHLYNASAYLDYESEESREALDLLLGVQGWRRFVFEGLAKAFDDAPEWPESPHVASKAAITRLAAMGSDSTVPPLATAGGMPEMMMMAGAAPPKMRAALPTPAPVPLAMEAEAEADGAEGFAQMADMAQMAPMAPMGQDLGDLGDAKLMPAPRMQGRHRKVMPWRTYAHEYRTRADNHGLEDTTQTLLWSGTVKSADAKLQFDLSDLHTSFRVTVDGVAADGTVFSFSRAFASEPPLAVSAAVPPILRQGDVARVPLVVSAADARKSEGADVSLSQRVEGGLTLGSSGESNYRQRRQSESHEVALLRAVTAGAGTFTAVVGSGQHEADTVEQVQVLAAGFPVDLSQGGLLTGKKEASVTIDMPSGASQFGNELEASITVSLSVLSVLEQAVERLIREPHGCFEQTASVTYPMVMALSLLERVGQRDCALAAKARSHLKSGYGKLVGFETKEKGFDWFGQAPAHEALTAYGLMQFADMAKVFDVDGDVLERTHSWLASRQDSATGGFLRSDKAIDSFGRAPEVVTDAYILFALSSILGNSELLVPTLEKVQAQHSTDSYVMALLANSLFNMYRTSEALPLCDELKRRQDDAGAVGQAVTSITSSRGISLRVETTALSVMAWTSQSDKYMGNIMSGASFLSDNINKGCGTQATLLALKALIAFDSMLGDTHSGGSVTLLVDGEKVQTLPIEGTEMAFEADPLLAALRQGGSHAVSLLAEIDGQGELSVPFSVSVRARVDKPTNPATPRVTLETSLFFADAVAGVVASQATGELVVTATAGSEAVSMPVAVVGLPAGVVPRFDRLRELRQAGTIAAFELADNAVVLYWRGFAPGSTHRVAFDVAAAFDGTYEAQPARVYPYYDTESTYWVDGLQVTVNTQ